MDWAEMVDANIQNFGEAVTYTPDGGQAVSITYAIWNEPDPDLMSSPVGRTNERRAYCTVQDDDVAQPERNAIVVRSSTSEEWTVSTWRSVRGVAWRLELTRAEPVERSHGVRNRR